MQRRNDVATAQFLDHFRYHHLSIATTAASEVALVATVKAKRISGHYVRQQVIWAVIDSDEIVGGSEVGDLQRIDLLQRRWLDHSCYFDYPGDRHFAKSGVGTSWQRGYCRYWVGFYLVG